MAESKLTRLPEFTTLRPSFPFFVGAISVVSFPVWLGVIAIDLLHLRPAKAGPLNYLSLGGILWSVSIIGASPSLFFHLRFSEKSLEFRWFGRPSLVLLYAEITSFKFSQTGLSLSIAGKRQNIYWVDLKRAADILEQHGVLRS